MRLATPALLFACLLGCGGSLTADGVAGSSGAAGRNGVAGNSGAAGNNGAAGSSGVAGSSGTAGVPGTGGGAGAGTACGAKPAANVTGTYALSLLAGAVYHDGPFDGSGPNFHFGAGPGDAVYERGTVYVADGPTIRKIDLATATMTTLAGVFTESCCMVDGDGTSARFSSISQLVSGGDGILYVLDQVSDFEAGLFHSTATIRRVTINTGAVTTLVLDRALDFGSGLAVDGQGHAYTSVGGAIVEVDLDSGISRVVAGVEDEHGSIDGVGVDARFVWINELAVDGDGQRLFACDNDISLRAVDLVTGAVTTTLSYQACDGLAYRAPGVLWVSAGFQVDRMDVATGNVDPFAVNYARYFTLDDMGGFYFAVGGASPSTLHRYDIAAQTDTIVAGDPMRVQDGVGSQARFGNSPSAMAVDHQGNLYVDGVRRIDSSTRAVTSIALPGPSGRTTLAATPAGDILAETDAFYGEASILGGFYRLDGNTFGLIGSNFGSFLGLVPQSETGALIVERGGPIDLLDLTSGQLTANFDGNFSTFVANVSGLSGDASGRLFFADAMDGVIFERMSSGEVVRVAGTTGACAFVDGAAPDARLGAPGALSFDGDDSLYVLDGPTLRKVTLSTGAVVTLVGPSSSLGAQVGLPGGLYQPQSLAVLPGGGIAIADSYAVLVATPPN